MSNVISIALYEDLVPEAGITGMDKWLHPTVFYGMQLIILA